MLKHNIKHSVANVVNADVDNDDRLIKSDSVAS